MTLKVDSVNTMSYTDFVGTVNQWNVLPGSYTTLNKRIKYSNINENSRLLEVACTTGFSVREISNLTGANGVGIDISEESINAAKLNQKKYGFNGNVKYQHIDAYKYSEEQKFTHIVVGAALKFFPHQKEIVNKINKLLQNNGYLLASPFFVHKKIPDEIIAEAKKVFGITVTNESYKEVMDLYNKHEILYEDIKYPNQESSEEIDYYVKSTIDRYFEDTNTDISDEDLYETMINRLKKIKIMSNKLRAYQGYSTLVLRYRENVYPNRFVELF